MTSLDAIARIARTEFAALPEEFRALAGSLTIAVVNDPTDEQLASLDLDHPDDLLGLFEGFGLAELGASPPTGVMPNRITLFRRPILNFAAEGDDTLEEVVRHVLVHEIGHHFGLSDDDMYAIDDAED